MLFEAKVVKEKSFDPYFTVNFSYRTDDKDLIIGTAEIVRKAPKSIIIYDENTENKIGTADRMNIEYGLLNTVIDYIFSNGVIRSWKGNIILRTA